MSGSRTGRGVALAGLALGVAVGAARQRSRAAARATSVSAPVGSVVGDRAVWGADGPVGRPVTVTADDGVRIAADVLDHPDPRFALVFAHGWTMNRRCWHPQLAALQDEATLVSYDQRGHGASTSGPIETCTIDRLGDDLADVIRETVPDGLPIVLVGHSMGGMTIMALVARHPELVAARVAGVALLGTSAGELENTTFGLPGPIGRLA